MVILSLAVILFSLSPALAQTPVTVVFWDNLFSVIEDQPKDQQFIFKAIAMFEAENPGIKIERVHNAPDIATFDQQLRAASIAGNGPDVTTQFAGGGLLGFSPFLEPLDSFFTAEEMSELVGWETVREDFKPDGKLMGVPYGAGSYFAIYYNKELMTKAGIDMANFAPPETWEDFLALAQKVKDGGVLPVAIGEQEGYTGAWTMATFVGGLLGPEGFFKMRSRELPINAPEWIKGYEAYKKLFDMGLTNPDAGTKQGGEGQLMFTQGQAAMWIQGGWANLDINNVLGEKAGLFPIPTLADSVYPGGVAGGPNIALGVMNYSKHKEESVKFLKFMLRPEVLDMYVELSQVEPSNHLKANTALIKNPLLQAQAEFLKARGKTIYPFDNIMPQEINTLFYRLNSAVFVGLLSPQEAADQLQAAYDQMK